MCFNLTILYLMTPLCLDLVMYPNKVSTQYIVMLTSQKHKLELPAQRGPIPFSILIRSTLPAPLKVKE